MRGSLYGIIVLAVFVSLLPVVIPESTDDVGDGVLTVVSPLAELLPVVILLAVVGPLVAYFIDDI